MKVTTSSSTYAQSNGQAERAVHTLKLLLKNADAEGRDPYIAMLEYRNQWAPLCTSTASHE